MKTTDTANDEGWSDERLLVKRIWSRAYLDTEEKHIGLLKAYADQQVKAERNKVLDEAIGKINKLHGATDNPAFIGVVKIIESLKVV